MGVLLLPCIIAACEWILYQYTKQDLYNIHLMSDPEGNSYGIYSK